MQVIFDFYYTKLQHHLSSILVNDNYWLWPWHDESCKRQVATCRRALRKLLQQLPTVASSVFGLRGGGADGGVDGA